MTFSERGKTTSEKIRLIDVKRTIKIIVGPKATGVENGSQVRAGWSPACTDRQHGGGLGWHAEASPYPFTLQVSWLESQV